MSRHAPRRTFLVFTHRRSRGMRSVGGEWVANGTGWRSARLVRLGDTRPVFAAKSARRNAALVIRGLQVQVL